MTFLIGLVIALITTLINFLMFLALLLRIKQRYFRELQLLKDLHREEWREMIGQINHAGSVPPGTRIIGLAHLLIQALINIIEQLKEQQSKRVWNNTYVILKIQDIVLVELQMLKKSIEDWLEQVRKSVKEFEHKQE